MKHELTLNELISELEHETAILLESTNSHEPIDINSDMFLQPKARHRKTKSQQPEHHYITAQSENPRNIGYSLSRIKAAAMDDYYTRHYNDEYPIPTWGANHVLQSSISVQLSLDDLIADNIGQKSILTQALDYFYETTPKRVFLGGKIMRPGIAETAYMYYLNEGLSNECFDAVTEYTKLSKSHGVVCIRINEVDSISCVF